MALFHHFDSLVIVPYQCRGIYESVVVLTGPNALHPDQREIQPPRGKFAEWLLYLQVGKYKSPTLLNLLLGMANTFKWHCRLLFRSSCCCLLATAYFFCYGISPSSLPICTACVLRLALSLSNRRLECDFTVFSLTKSFSAISRLLMPFAINSSISSSKTLGCNSRTPSVLTYLRREFSNPVATVE